jgi:hypothetical protein
MPRKKDTITLSIPPGTKERLEAIAREFKIFWGKEPSISGLIVAIATQSVAVSEQFSLENIHVRSLEKAIKLLIDTGSLRDAQVLVELLLAKAILTPDRRQALLQSVSQPDEGWRILVDRYHEQKQPFRLLYQTPQGENQEFTVRYGEIAFHEKRFYLDAWCEEMPDLSEHPELTHNRCYRLDRIKAIVPISGEWRETRLETMEVQLHFYRGLVKAYEFRSGIDEREEFEGQALRRVWRRISNPFWFLREILPYGADCEVVAPASIRMQAKKAVASMLANYDRM